MFGAIMDGLQNIGNQMWADERMEDTQQFNAGEAHAKRMWDERMRSTAYQTAVQDMRSAGLNPMLAYHHGGAGQPTGATASSSAPGNPATTPFSASMQSAAQVELAQSAAEANRAQAAKATAEKGEIEARTPTHAVNIDRMKQEIKQSEVLIEKIIQETKTSGHSAANIQQQTENLKEAIPQIRATVQHLKTLANLNREQAKLAGAHTAQSDAQYDEIRQRIRANLPEIERGLKDLELRASGMTMPARGMDAAANSSFLGAFRAAVRALTGQQAITGK